MTSTQGIALDDRTVASEIRLDAVDEAALARFAQTVAMALKAGDCLDLIGDLGAGKTTFVRALLRAAGGDRALDVPSPTFTLLQLYDGLPFGPFAHADLYRIEQPEEVDELGIAEILQDGVVAIEWPERGADRLPSANLRIAITERTPDTREIVLTGSDEAIARIRRSLVMDDFLSSFSKGDIRRHHLTGDASTRSYETVIIDDGAPLVLMNSPEQPDGPPIRDGKSYSAIAHLAENVRPFVGVGTVLSEAGFCTPRLHAHDLDAGLLLIDHLGDRLIVDEHGAPVEQRYIAAIETLSRLHERQWSNATSLPDGTTHTIPPYDRSAMEVETSLLADWYAPHRLNRELTTERRDAFVRIWQELIDAIGDAERSLVLRDFHSPNIIWRGDRIGDDRIGIIDYQDALIGPSAYDVASIAQDARVDIPADFERRLVDRYLDLRPARDREAFQRDYAIMCALRVTKIMGIFVRLSKRDGKHAYIGLLPRMEGYLSRCLAHPALAAYRSWIESEFGMTAEPAR